MIRILIVIGTGGILGFLALYFQGLMLALCAALAVVLALFYARTGRPVDIGWLLIGAGAVPTYFSGRNVYDSLVDPAVSVGPDTYVLLAAAASVLIVGIGAVLVLYRHRLNGSARP